MRETCAPMQRAKRSGRVVVCCLSGRAARRESGRGVLTHYSGWAMAWQEGEVLGARRGAFCEVRQRVTRSLSLSHSGLQPTA